MLRVVRRGDRHDPRDLTVSVRFEGAFDPAFVEGRSEGLLLPGEAIKNLVHTTVRRHGAAQLEEIGLLLAREVIARHPRMSRVRVELIEQRWQRLDAGGRPQPRAFTAGPAEERVAVVTTNGSQSSVVAGVGSLTVMRTAGFAATRGEEDALEGAFDGRQPLLVGTLGARWTYTTGEVTFDVYHQGVRAAIIDTFAWHQSASIQHALYAVAEVVLSTYEEIADISLAFHERPYRPADLFAAGTENPDELFLVVEEPVGIVEVTVERRV